MFISLMGARKVMLVTGMARTTSKLLELKQEVQNQFLKALSVILITEKSMGFREQGFVKMGCQQQHKFRAWQPNGSGSYREEAKELCRE
jgi:hypothetical protein